MDKLSSKEVKITNFYQNLWSNPKKIRRNKNLNLGWHLGYYEDNTKSYKEALQNMNNFVGKLLDLNKDMDLKILDAGCGVGATLTHLAKNFSSSKFYGITLSSNEITLANKLKKEKNLGNVKFFQQSYNNTEFPTEYFDGVYSLESACHAEDYQIYLKEINRIIKKNGKFVVIDFFMDYKFTNPFITIIKDKIIKDKDYQKSNIHINFFKELLNKQGFKDIQIENLLKNRNVKSFYFYSFVFQTLLFNSINKLKEKTIKKEKNLLILPWNFLHYLLFTILFEIISKPQYYSIIAVKK